MGLLAPLTIVVDSATTNLLLQINTMIDKDDGKQNAYDFIDNKVLRAATRSVLKGINKWLEIELIYIIAFQ